MPIYAQKTRFGYKELSSEASEWSLATTHVILTWDEYLDYKDFINRLKSELQDAKYQSEQDLREAEQEYRDRYLHLKHNLEDEHKKNDTKVWLLHQGELAELKDAVVEKEKTIESLEEKIFDLEKQIELQKNQNQNFLRIARERGNHDRGVTPKKVHHGYLFMGSVQAVDRVQVPDPNDAWNDNVEQKIVWRTILQTPYTILLDIRSLATSIQTELFDSVLGEIGVNTDIQPENGTYPLDNDTDCIAYRWLFRAAKSGFWEVEIWTTSSVLVLEKNLPPKNDQRKAKGGEKNDNR